MIIAISQRHVASHGSGDLLEANYAAYFGALGATLISIPNQPGQVKKYFQSLSIDRLILSGGGDIDPKLYGEKPVKGGTYSTERQETEKVLINLALEQDIPILGVCRGMEMLNIYFGGKMQRTAVDNAHDETRHSVTVLGATIQEALGVTTAEVNSYHRMVITDEQLAPSLAAFAISSDHTIEGFYSSRYPAAGIIWHPEREQQNHDLNKRLIQAFLARKLFWQTKQRGDTK